MSFSEDAAWSHTCHVTEAQQIGVASLYLSLLCSVPGTQLDPELILSGGLIGGVLQEPACGTEESQTQKLRLATNLEFLARGSI